MLNKKNPDIEVGRNSSLYFAIGLILMLLATRSLLEYKTYDKSATDIGIVNIDEIEDIVADNVAIGTAAGHLHIVAFTALASMSL